MNKEREDRSETVFSETRVVEPGIKRFVVVWIGQVISLVGSSMTTFALGIWVYSRVHAALPFALILLIGNVPQILLAPVAGLVADRVSRRRVVVFADAGNAAVILVTAIVLRSNSFMIGYAYLVALGLAIFSTFQEIAYISFVTDLVSEQELDSTNGLLQIGQALELLLAPIIAGTLFLLIGFANIVLIDFITYFFAFFTLIGARALPRTSDGTADESHSWLANMFQGWSYLRHNRGLFNLLWYFAGVSFLLNFANVLVGPMVLSFSSSVVLGSIQTASGFGLLLGGIALSSRKIRMRRVPLVLNCVIVTGIGLILTGLRAEPLTIGVGLFVAMVSTAMASGVSQTIFQAVAPPSLLGRVLAIRSAISRSVVPLAFLIAGILADRIFEPLLRNTGVLTHTLIGDFIGTGPGRGTALLVLLSGIAMVVISIIAFAIPSIRNLNEKPPD